MNNNSAAQAEIRKLKQQIELVEVQNKKYEAQLENVNHQLKESQEDLKKQVQWGKSRVGNLAEHYEDAGKFRGRNQVKASEFDVLDRHNREVLSKWLRFFVMPHVKFFSKDMMKYSEDKHSMCQRIMAIEDVMFPDGAVKAMSYDTRLVPIANRIVVDRKSMFTIDLRKEWASKCYFHIDRLLCVP